jgi:predicted Zn-dependent peptidase
VKEIRTSRHASGLTIVTARCPQMASVSLGLWVGVGSRHEPEARNGAAHFLEHMLFKGTRRRSPEQISQAVEGIGGYLNAFTSEEHTCYFSKALHDRFPELLDVLMDMALEPLLAPRDIRLEREVIKEELAMCFDDPQQYVQELINETLWPGHPLGRPLAGTSRTLDALRRRELLDFKNRAYVAGNMVLAAAGNLHHQDLLRAADRYARRLPRGGRPAWTPAPGGQSGPRLRLSSRKSAQTQMVAAFRTCSRHDRRAYPMRLLNALIGENMSSRLFQELRERRGLVYYIQSQISFFEETGTFDVGLGLDTENAPTALRMVLATLRRIAETPPSRSELGRARDFVLGQMALSLENTEHQMNWLGEQWLGFGRIISPAQVRRGLENVTPEAVQGAARDFFRPDRLSVALVSPLKSSRELERVLGLA